MPLKIKSKRKCILCPYDAIYCHVVVKRRESHLKKNDLLPITKEIFRLPKYFDDAILAELEAKGLIKRINHQSYFIFRGTKETESAKDKIQKLKRHFPW